MGLHGATGELETGHCKTAHDAQKKSIALWRRQQALALPEISPGGLPQGLCSSHTASSYAVGPNLNSHSSRIAASLQRASCAAGLGLPVAWYQRPRCYQSWGPGLQASAALAQVPTAAKQKGKTSASVVMVVWPAADGETEQLMHNASHTSGVSGEELNKHHASHMLGVEALGKESTDGAQ